MQGMGAVCLEAHMHCNIGVSDTLLLLQIGITEAANGWWWFRTISSKKLGEIQNVFSSLSLVCVF
jgi:hypothetical protein